MLNKKSKGFTIVELVIVIAVIAILAAVLIPTFAGIIDKANESADKQAVRQMNIALAAESIENEPDDVGDVIDILADAGFNSTDKLVPVSAKHGFYWSAEANMITLIRDEGENSPELIFPTEEAAVNAAFEAAKTKSAINFGANKADESDERTFFDLEPAGEAAGLPTGGSGGTEPTAQELLIKALTEGGEFTLTGDMVISEVITIPAGKTATINLNGCTLQVNDSNPTDEEADAEGSTITEEDFHSAISVEGALEIVDGSDSKTGKVVLGVANGTYSDYYSQGIYVKQGGTLNLTGVNIEGNRGSKYTGTNINNEGTVNLTNGTVFTVKNAYGGTGLYNSAGSATISESYVVASGSNVIPIYGDGDGSMSITGTEFTEATGSSYEYSFNAQIVWGSSGTLTLTDVKASTNGITDDEGNTTYSANAIYATGPVNIYGGTYEGNVMFTGSSTKVTIDESESGKTPKFNGAFSCSNDAEVEISNGKIVGQVTCNNAKITISGGEYSAFYCKGDTVVNISGGTFNDKFTFKDNEPIITISGGTFYNGVTYANLATVAVTDIIYTKSGIVMNNTYNSSGYWTIGHTSYIGQT